MLNRFCLDRSFSLLFFSIASYSDYFRCTSACGWAALAFAGKMSKRKSKDDVYTVEAVINKRVQDGKVQYLLKWKVIFFKFYFLVRQRWCFWTELSHYVLYQKWKTRKVWKRLIIFYNLRVQAFQWVPYEKIICARNYGNKTFASNIRILYKIHK